ncbi:hypothetical protein FNV43_RR06401 [Rhamnella rubrinervis]|uniref:Cationic amino acid transporter C-terminal domain-containing protein n=1 Tax=Rhamnella rubrinervis TaxID=2594499 RepID=A0A8K0ML95_9ROSA|nr:hypothetical protein FNV43_RR06401 [Rhamnella rubrinervis]
MMPPWLAHFKERTGSPLNATVATAVIAFFVNIGILANLLSISTLFIFMMVGLALLVRRYYVAGVTTEANRIKLIVCILLILGSSIACAIYWGQSDGWIGYAIALPFWLIGTVGLWLFVPQAGSPKLWGVPLVPWLPSGSIVMNIFLLGSIDQASFVRFAVRTGIILLYYFFFGLHASYDTAKEDANKKKEGVSELKKVEEGSDNVS